jgi:hypothetical protein
MNVAESTAARPSHRDEVGKRIQRIVERMPAEKTLAALAPFSRGSAEEAISAMFSEVDSVLTIALDILEWHLDGADRGTWGSKVSDLVFAAQRRLQCACSMHEAIVTELAKAVAADEAPDSQIGTIG